MSLTYRGALSLLIFVSTATLATACGSSAGDTASPPHPVTPVHTSAPSTVPPVTASPTTPSATRPPATTHTAAPTRTATHVSASATRVVTVRPVDSAGRPVSGWTVRTESGDLDCSGAEQSPAGTSASIVFCSPDAASALACWRAADHRYALCLLDPSVHTLYRWHLTGGAFVDRYPSSAAPRPAALDLVGGAHCAYRLGAGEILRSMPSWTDLMGCSGALATWGPHGTGASDGINRSASSWTVQVAPIDGHTRTTTTRVTTAYLVGTA